MTTRRTGERTPLQRDCDVLVCGASFAGLAVAGELAGAGARVLVIDRYEIGERQTSACAAPTRWLSAMGLTGAIRQTFPEIVLHVPQRTLRYGLPWSFSTFDYRALCAALWGRCDAEFQTATVQGITRYAGGEAPGPLAGCSRHVVHTDRGDLTAPLVVDALGWKRVLAANGPVNAAEGAGGGPRTGPAWRRGPLRPRLRMSRGLEVHPEGAGNDLEIWIDKRYVRAGYAWSFPARNELRVGAGSFEPRDHVKQPTLRLADDLSLPAVRFQGNWIPHRLRPAVDDGVFFAGDSSGHCLPLTAEGIRTALYFGIACGRELRAVVDARTDRGTALSRYASFSDDHAWAFRWLLRVQHAVGMTTGTWGLGTALRAMDRPAVIRWMFDHYLAIAPPSFVTNEDPPPAAPAGRPRAVTA